jgi:pimeloyl-ACP methyl ester carboxylesterase
VPPIQTQKEAYLQDSVTSRDGTRIGYRRYGRGPGIILVQGAMGTAHNFHQLESSLANKFAVIVPDRQGRGLSPHQFGPDHCLQRELEDLDSLFGQTGAEFLFGLSSGGVIALEASRHLTSIRKMTLYEPPLPVGSRRFACRRCKHWSHHDAIVPRSRIDAGRSHFGAKNILDYRKLLSGDR